MYSLIQAPQAVRKINRIRRYVEEYLNVNSTYNLRYGQRIMMEMKDLIELLRICSTTQFMHVWWIRDFFLSAFPNLRLHL